MLAFARCLRFAPCLLSARWLCITCTLCVAFNLHAQDFDLEPNDVPVWDALERFRDDQLCLHSIPARELTVLPGISLRIAHRILNIVALRPTMTFEELADSACLSVEQMIVLASCTTLDCSKHPFVRSAWARMRDRDGRRSVRSDFISSIGRVGMIYDNDTLSAWLSATLQWSSSHLTVVQSSEQPSAPQTTLHLGAMRAGAGMGLLLGGSGRFGSSISARAGSSSDAPLMRAFTSSYLDGSLRGVALHHAADSWSALAGYSKHTSEREERALYVALQSAVNFSGLGLTIRRSDIGLALLALDYASPSDSRAASVVKSASLVSASLFSTLSFDGFDVRTELAIDNFFASAFTLVARGIAHPRRPQWSFGLRNFSADYHAPYAASISDASYISNEYGAYVATDLRIQKWTLNATLDIHGSRAPRFGAPLPTRGFDMQVAALIRTPLEAASAHGETQQCSLDIRARYERDTEGWRPPDDSFTHMYKGADTRDGDADTRDAGTTRMHTRSRLSLRCETGMQVSRDVKVRARIDLRAAMYTSERTSDEGWATFIDAQWQATWWMAARCRITVFNSASIDVAPYYVETDALGATRTVACSGQGSRQHVALRFTPVTFATIALSVAREDRSTDVSRPLSALVQLDIRLPR